MTLAQHLIETVFTPRLLDSRILIVYDEHDRYQDLCEMKEKVEEF
jgi:hypothetical protein